jgi:hypothetical protein
VRLHLAPVKALLATAVEEGLIRSNPSTGLRLAVAHQEADDGHVKALTEEELEKLLAARPAAGRGPAPLLPRGVRHAQVPLRPPRRSTVAALAGELERRWLLEEDVEGLVFRLRRGPSSTPLTSWLAC